MTDLPIPAPRFDAQLPADARCIGLATDAGPWPICVRCARRDAHAEGWYVAPAGVIGAAGAECVNKLVRSAT